MPPKRLFIRVFYSWVLRNGVEMEDRGAVEWGVAVPSISALRLHDHCPNARPVL